MILQLIKVADLLTLDPLLTHGQAALMPDPASRIIQVTLRMLGILSLNAFNGESIQKADDLFACAANSGCYHDPFPKGAHLSKAGFDLLYEDSPEPRSIEIVPPHILKLQDRAEAPRILLFLARRGFQKIQKALLALILASAAFSPGGCLGDDLEDDSEHNALAHHWNR
jgi:hypothetical protein